MMQLSSSDQDIDALSGLEHNLGQHRNRVEVSFRLELISSQHPRQNDLEVVRRKLLTDAVSGTIREGKVVVRVPFLH
ncbi:hypothetical protein PFISCL1PPCAC_12823, partial [Pristionchus fissidentatus]